MKKLCMILFSIVIVPILFGVSFLIIQPFNLSEELTSLTLTGAIAGLFSLIAFDRFAESIDFKLGKNKCK